MEKIEVTLDTRYTFVPGEAVFYYSRGKVQQGVVRKVQYHTTYLTQVSANRTQTVELHQRIFYLIEHNNRISKPIHGRKVAATEEILVQQLKENNQ